ncbi:MAG: hypothetical protein V2A73_09675 [Pseudomonadota bacterium]
MTGIAARRSSRLVPILLAVVAISNLEPGGEVWASTQPGVAYQSQYYALGLYSQRRYRPVAKTPSEYAQFFLDLEEDYRRRLAPQVPALTALVENARSRKELPLVELGFAVEETVTADLGAQPVAVIGPGMVALTVARERGAEYLVLTVNLRKVTSARRLRTLLQRMSRLVWRENETNGQVAERGQGGGGEGPQPPFAAADENDQDAQGKEIVELAPFVTSGEHVYVRVDPLVRLVDAARNSTVRASFSAAARSIADRLELLASEHPEEYPLRRLATDPETGELDKGTKLLWLPLGRLRVVVAAAATAPEQLQGRLLEVLAKHTRE